jgi:hypothetical protein
MKTKYNDLRQLRLFMISSNLTIIQSNDLKTRSTFQHCMLKRQASQLLLQIQSS